MSAGHRCRLAGDQWTGVTALPKQDLEMRKRSGDLVSRAGMSITGVGVEMVGRDHEGKSSEGVLGGRAGALVERGGRAAVS